MWIIITTSNVNCLIFLLCNFSFEIDAQNHCNYNNRLYDQYNTNLKILQPQDLKLT